jgi:ribosomal protein S18 acetylase RimI-like enzyme
VVSLELRPAGPGDGELLLRIYAGTRAQELAVLPLDDAAKAAFLRAQLTAQSAAYDQNPGRSNRLVVVDGEPVGRLDVARGEREIMVLDISLLPEHRGRGIGTAVLREVLDEAAAARKRVRIHVERSNPALRLYRRLGFSEVADLGVYLRLEAAPYVKTAS